MVPNGRNKEHGGAQGKNEVEQAGLRMERGASMQAKEFKSEPVGKS